MAPKGTEPMAYDFFPVPDATHFFVCAIKDIEPEHLEQFWNTESEKQGYSIKQHDTAKH